MVNKLGFGRTIMTSFFLSIVFLPQVLLAQPKSHLHDQVLEVEDAMRLTVAEAKGVNEEVRPGQISTVLRFKRTCYAAGNANYLMTQAHEEALKDLGEASPVVKALDEAHAVMAEFGRINCEVTDKTFIYDDEIKDYQAQVDKVYTLRKSLK